jgi:hypothetical protein
MAFAHFHPQLLVQQSEQQHRIWKARSLDSKEQVMTMKVPLHIRKVFIRSQDTITTNQYACFTLLKQKHFPVLPCHGDQSAEAQKLVTLVFYIHVHDIDSYFVAHNQTTIMEVSDKSHMSCYRKSKTGWQDDRLLLHEIIGITLPNNY